MDNQITEAQKVAIETLEEGFDVKFEGTTDKEAAAFIRRYLSPKSNGIRHDEIEKAFDEIVAEYGEALRLLSEN